MKLYKEVYETLIKEDLEALKAMPDSPERQHIEDVLKDSIKQYYSTRKSDCLPVSKTLDSLTENEKLKALIELQDDKIKELRAVIAGLLDN